MRETSARGDAVACEVDTAEDEEDSGTGSEHVFFDLWLSCKRGSKWSPTFDLQGRYNSLTIQWETSGLWPPRSLNFFAN